MEKTPYPDDHGRVKCFYCRRLTTQCICLVMNRTMTGISLLRVCEQFVMKDHSDQDHN